jgi:hypothetical protein
VVKALGRDGVVVGFEIVEQGFADDAAELTQEIGDFFSNSKVARGVGPCWRNRPTSGRRRPRKLASASRIALVETGVPGVASDMGSPFPKIRCMRPKSSEKGPLLSTRLKEQGEFTGPRTHQQRKSPTSDWNEATGPVPLIAEWTRSNMNWTLIIKPSAYTGLSADFALIEFKLVCDGGTALVLNPIGFTAENARNKKGG